jgi:hypothetical protein
MGFKVQVETVDYCVTKGAVDLAAGDWAKHVPNQLSGALSCASTGPAALTICCTSQREHNGLSVLRLAGLDVLPMMCVSETRQSIQLTFLLTQSEGSRGRWCREKRCNCLQH